MSAIDSRFNSGVDIKNDKTHITKIRPSKKDENWSYPYLPYIKFISLFLKFIVIDAENTFCAPF